MKAKKIVITGGPSTGKSAIIDELTKRGYTCYEEISRQVTLEAREKGIEQMFLTEPLLFSELLLKGREQQYVDAVNSSSEFVFLDRGVPDVVAYMDYAKEDYPEKFTKSCIDNTYDYVFILAPWQEIYKSDAVRYESFEQAKIIHQNLLKSYEKYDYNLQDVPFGSIETRAQHILDVVKAL
ncbi:MULTISPECIES: AAA family ATPase [unclassified Olleya]|uniref:AAA family ATPase n=1 Tax=unclassified Olleya TaxID=2615019 RepID=UPI000C3120E0|nr:MULTISPECIES: ATP-binding protein [unclassified Olleya]AUC75971.1 ATPase [Olleya sp. Bg11-27]QXP61836.1 ATP-binding protein [Olleya sp. HaHaR_3_96]